ncbi:hypothetical protein ACFWUW_11980 [Streptomyces sp. NPDC058655]
MTFALLTCTPMVAAVLLLLWEPRAPGTAEPPVRPGGPRAAGP